MQSQNNQSKPIPYSKIIPSLSSKPPSAGVSTNPSQKKLTHGMTSYKDIKQNRSHHLSNSMDKSKVHHVSGSKGKRGSEDADRESVECTFAPKTNQGTAYRTFKDFVDFQESFLNKKEEKISKKKRQIQAKQLAEATHAPKIDKNSRRLSQEHCQQSCPRLAAQKKANFHQRLYNPRPHPIPIPTQQQTFTPKILQKSKSMVRNDRVQNLLYEDAQRRLEQQKVQEGMRKEGGSRVLGGGCKRKDNVKLVCRKIRGQFVQLLQMEGEWTQQSCNNISPILALALLSQIFNIDINPNKNQNLCYFILSLTQDQVDIDAHGEAYVSTRKLWDFIKAIVGGVDSYEKACSYTEQQVAKIYEELGYFYSLRLSKMVVKGQVEDTPVLIETSEKTKRMAEAHRSRKLQQISQFIAQTNIIQIVSSKPHHEQSIKQEGAVDQKSITLQDLLILDSIRKQSQNERKKLQKEEEQMKKCTFKPSLNEKSIQKAMERKVRSKEKSHQQEKLHEEQRDQKETKEGNKQNDEKCKKIIIKSKKNQPRESEGTCRDIKNVDKTLLRLNLGRKMRDVENTHKERGYEAGSENWLQQTKGKKKQVEDEMSKYLGYKQTPNSQPPCRS